MGRNKKMPLAPTEQARGAVQHPLKKRTVPNNKELAISKQQYCQG
jgi:hypothetical protein